MNFIRLTLTVGGDVFVNLDNVTAIGSANQAAWVAVIGEGTYRVVESPQEILRHFPPTLLPRNTPDKTPS